MYLVNISALNLNPHQQTDLVSISIPSGLLVVLKLKVSDSFFYMQGKGGSEQKWQVDWLINVCQSRRHDG